MLTIKFLTRLNYAKNNYYPWCVFRKAVWNSTPLNAFAPSKLSIEDSATIFDWYDFSIFSFQRTQRRPLNDDESDRDRGHAHAHSVDRLGWIAGSGG